MNCYGVRLNRDDLSTQSFVQDVYTKNDNINLRNISIFQPIPHLNYLDDYIEAFK
jgi:hypothetical protein